ncbi:PEP-CTERM sorting domain-containing protein [Desulfonatronum parangueonense]
MRKTIFILMVACLLMVGLVAKGMALTLETLDKTNTKQEPYGGFLYAEPEFDLTGYELGDYMGRGLHTELPAGKLEDLFIYDGSPYTDVKILDEEDDVIWTKYMLKENELDEYIAGTWKLTDEAIDDKKYVTFLVVSGGSYFSVHQYDSALFGKWDTGWLESGMSGNPYPGISYVKAFQDGNGTPDVPEPGTMLLLGFGLAGLALMRRKFSK